MSDKSFVLNFVDLDIPEIMVDSSKTIVYSLDIHKFVSFLVSNEFSGFVFTTQEGYLYAFSDDNMVFIYVGDDMNSWRKKYEKKRVIKSK